MSASRYWELSVSVPPDASEGLTNFVWELGALGVVEEELPGGAARLRAFFAETATSAQALQTSVRDYLEGLRVLGFKVGEDPCIAPLHDVGWAEAWREHFRPLPVGRGLVIAPPWETAAPNGRLVITIEPGRAFGTGHHATTAGCLQALEAIVERDRPGGAIDLGTGSGILAIAMARLGGAAVLAVDDDPDAVANAVANVARNHVSDRVRCVLGDAGTVPTDPGALVVANLMTTAHVRLAAAYRRYVAAGGSLVLGGILEAETAEVVSVVSGEGFALCGAKALDGWATLEFSRRE